MATAHTAGKATMTHNTSYCKYVRNESQILRVFTYKEQEQQSGNRVICVTHWLRAHRKSTASTDACSCSVLTFVASAGNGWPRGRSDMGAAR